MIMKTKESFDKVVEEARGMRHLKTAQYSEARHEIADAEESLLLCRSDVLRKQLRLKQLTKSALLDPVQAEKLRSDYLDLAVYAMNAVVEIDRLGLTTRRVT